MQIAHVAIQCQSIDGKIGDFLYSGESHKAGAPLSPVFKSLSELYSWTRQNGWRDAKPEDVVAVRPCGTYVKQLS